jgi:hypothetical protein
MTHLSSTSVAVGRLSLSLPNEAWGYYHSPDHFSKFVRFQGHPTQVHIQITIFFNTPKIDDSNEFVGSALARFERSTLPSHKGKRILVLRFLQIITPVTCVIPSYDGFIVAPTEGELHQKCKNTNLYKEVWSVDIDKGGVMVPGLRLLWDATSTL